MYRSIITFLATGCYSGLSPKAPGTAGSFAAAALLYAATFVGCFTSGISVAVLALCTSVLGIFICNESLRLSLFGSESDDPKQIVIDEFAGLFIAAIGFSASLTHLTIALLFFRLFDVLKPVPISTLESAPRGWGIMLDDIAAGIAANLATLSVVYFLQV